VKRALAVSLPNLIEHMRDVAARTLDPGLRYHNEPDAVLYGKVVMLETLAEPHYTSSDLTEDEKQALMSASKALGRAYDHLATIVFPQGGKESC